MLLKEISAGIIIYRKTKEGIKFLLLYHGGDYWNFPKGKIEAEERSFQTAVREISEETGLLRKDLKFLSPFKVYEKFTFWRGRGAAKAKVFKIVIFYLAQTMNPIVRVSREHNGYAWFSYKEAMKILNKYKDSQKVLTRAHEFIGGPIRHKNISVIKKISP
ncbi:NUDIX domain-containing protein [Candidatus Wolfebacteria bacterium]|nr:NUDIX domain-containing protein [Candidatus Wolfebacteria bacterium]